MKYKIIIIAVFILFFGLVFFWRQINFNSFREEKFFTPLYIVEVPPRSKYLTDGGSNLFYNSLQLFQQKGVFIKKDQNILPSLLQLFDVQYVLLRDKKYWEIFEPFLDYSPGEEKEELPRTFPVKKEALASSGEPLLILGKGWHDQEKNPLFGFGAPRWWFSDEATINYIIPPGALTQAPRLLRLSVASLSSEEEKMEIIINGKRKEELIFSHSLLGDFPSDYLLLTGLQKGINEIKFRSSSPSKCLSFSIESVEVFKLEDIPMEGLLRLDHLTETENGVYLMEANAAIEVFALFPDFYEVVFEIQTLTNSTTINIFEEKREEIKEQKLFLSDGEFKKVRLAINQQGKNRFIFIAEDCNDMPEEKEKQCIVVQIKNIKIQPIELFLSSRER